MERRRQAVFYFVAAGLFGLAFLLQVGRHGFGVRAVVAAVLAAILAVVGMKMRREELEGPRDRDE